MSAQWNPEQYNKFKDQRAKPFYDLLALVDHRSKLNRVVDLGCGTGELSRHLFDELKPASMTGIDASREMLARSEEFKTPGLAFELGDIAAYRPPFELDLVFSNAALQWVADHESLFARLMGLVAVEGQIAVQMPYNFDHPSHSIARDIATKLFPAAFSSGDRQGHMLRQERYAEILYAQGFQEQVCRIEIYGHPMPSGAEVVEWTKGTALTTYQTRLTAEEFQRFLAVYRDELVRAIGSGPYFYAFKRLLMWGRKSAG